MLDLLMDGLEELTLVFPNPGLVWLFHQPGVFVEAAMDTERGLPPCGEWKVSVTQARGRASTERGLSVRDASASRSHAASDRRRQATLSMELSRQEY